MIDESWKWKQQDMMRQCTLTRDNQTQTAWIPSKYAKVGRTIKIRTDGVWVDGWVVSEAGNIDVDSQIANERSRDWTHQRGVSDI